MTSVLPTNYPHLLGVVSKNPGRAYTGKQLISLYNITDKKFIRIFNQAKIDQRYLTLPEPGADGYITPESSAELAEKHKKVGTQIAIEVSQSVLQSLGLNPQDIGYIVCVSSTGFLCPGLSTYVARELHLDPGITQVDITGMGCNAGLNGMNTVSNYCRLNPNGYGLLVCVEICSATYRFSFSEENAVNNSLFGDGAVAVVLGQKYTKDQITPHFIGFYSCLLVEYMDLIRFEYNEGIHSLVLDRNVPKVVCSNIRKPVEHLLKQHGLAVKDVAHWVVHSGGRRVTDAIRDGLALDSEALRHTESVMKDMGNVSSSSFLFSYQRLIEEGAYKKDDYMMMITVGPGLSIQCALARF